MLMQNGVVAVKYQNRYTGEFEGGEYSYFTDVPLKVGMLVKAPTKYGDRLAKVSKNNVDPMSIPLAIRNAMRTIKQENVVKTKEPESDSEQLTLEDAANAFFE